MDLWKKRQPWTVIDDQIREGNWKTVWNNFFSCFKFMFKSSIAVLQRNVTVKFLVNSRASHLDLMLKHMDDLLNVNLNLIEIKIYSVSSIYHLKELTLFCTVHNFWISPNSILAQHTVLLGQNCTIFITWKFKRFTSYIQLFSW